MKTGRKVPFDRFVAVPMNDVAPGLTLTERVVLGYLASEWTRSEGDVFPVGTGRLADDIGASRRAVELALRKLEAEGLVRCVEPSAGGRGRFPTYSLTLNGTANDVRGSAHARASKPRTNRERNREATANETANDVRETAKDVRGFAGSHLLLDQRSEIKSENVEVRVRSEGTRPWPDLEDFEPYVEACVRQHLRDEDWRPTNDDCDHIAAIAHLSLAERDPDGALRGAVAHFRLDEDAQLSRWPLGKLARSWSDYVPRAVHPAPPWCSGVFEELALALERETWSPGPELVEWVGERTELLATADPARVKRAVSAVVWDELDEIGRRIAERTGERPLFLVPSWVQPDEDLVHRVLDVLEELEATRPAGSTRVDDFGGEP